jgi:hypothetical protein
MVRKESPIIRLMGEGFPAFAGTPPKLKGVSVTEKLVSLDYDFSGREVWAELPAFVRERKPVSGLPSFAKRTLETD